MSKKKKIILISSIVVASFVVIGLVYALVTSNVNIFGKTTTGSVEIETINLGFTNEEGVNTNLLEPAGVNDLYWSTKNIGTSGILTRHTLEIYWNDETDEKASDLIYLYPANLTKEQILADYENGLKYAIKTEKVSKNDNNKTTYGIKYQFIGDTLDGTDMKGVSNEVNYNIADYNLNTDDTDEILDSIGFKVLLSPKTSYLYQDKKLSVKVVTEAMQYTENGSGEW
ncbi:MAG: hypothetical protein IJ287_06700, partial [Methanobrevibacter sp.]|nr:hypothetical protein [Methanobrevibacter sp.]